MAVSDKSPIKVAFLGPAGSFSHQAALQQFQKDNVEYVPQSSIANCFTAIESQKADYSVIPLENSTNGQVAFSYDLLRNHFFHSNLNQTNISNKKLLQVTGEQFVAIHHNLLTHCDSVDKIVKIYSHPQVWSQCTHFFSTVYGQASHVDKIDTSSTSRATQLVLQDISNGITNTASISSPVASQIYNLKALKTNIEDDSNNTTRFLVLQEKSTHILNNITNTPKDSTPQSIGLYITFIAIRIQNENTGFLCDALGIFKKHNINLTSITTRPSQIVKWQYIFFIEFWGNSNQDHNVQQCLRELEESVIELKIIGSFPRNPQYFNNKIKPNLQ